MTDIVHLPQSLVQSHQQQQQEEFKMDILHGFNQCPKRINSKYFYDAQGSELFNRITHHQDYYLTNCELEILEKYKSKIANIAQDKPINLIELGPGEGIKTELLIDTFLQKRLEFTYIPIDVSSQFLETMVTKLDKHQPAIHLLPLHGDYFNGLKWVNLDSNLSNLVLFLGSSIGNYSLPQAHQFLCHLRENLHPHDYVLIGFDLRKNIEVLMRAYNDSDGITREFNLNLLRRINRELQGNFNLEKFNHFPVYNATLGTMESYLISVEPQIVSIDALQQKFQFEMAEPIHVEYSYKYLLTQVNMLATNAGFHIVENYLDSHQYFVDSLWQVNA